MKKLIAYAGALLLALGVTLAVAAPAQAYGWTAQRCFTQASNGSKVCAAVHTVPRGSGLRIDQIQMCNYKIDGSFASHFRGTKTNSIELVGSNGARLDGEGLHDVGASYAGVCAYDTIAVDGGNQSCWTLSGWRDEAQFFDQSYSLSGASLGGAC